MIEVIDKIYYEGNNIIKCGIYKGNVNNTRVNILVNGRWFDIARIKKKNTSEKPLLIEWLYLGLGCVLRDVYSLVYITILNFLNDLYRPFWSLIRIYSFW